MWYLGFSLPADNAGGMHPGLAGPIVGTHEDVLFIGGGANFPSGMPWHGNSKNYADVLYAYRHNELGPPVFLGEFQLSAGIAYTANYSTPLGVVAVGGENEQGLRASTLLIRWDKRAQKPDVRYLADLPVGVSNASVASVGNTLFCAGGDTQDSVSDTLYSLDLLNHESMWEVHGKLPVPVSHTCLVRHRDSLFLMGGRQRKPGGVSDFYDQVWSYDIPKGEWAPCAPLPKPLSAATAVAITDDMILFIGGDDGGTYRQVEEVLAEISHAEDEQKKARLNQQKINLLEGHPGFERAVWAYHIQENTWYPHSVLQPDAPVTTTAVWWYNSIYLPSGEIRAGVRSPHILVGERVETATTKNNT